MATGDDYAWISLVANGGTGTWDMPLGEMCAHKAGWSPPPEYHRTPLALAPGLNTVGALLNDVNESRAKLGRGPITLAKEQSALLESLYLQAFPRNAKGDWVGDRDIRSEALRGRAVQKPIWWGRIVSGIAFDGNAGDWLGYRMLIPVSRESLMSPLADQIALAVHGDPSVGFGALAVVYSLFTPERAHTLAVSIAERIAALRGDRSTHRVGNPPELEEAAHAVASGSALPERAFRVALNRLNLGSQGHRVFDVAPLDLAQGLPDFGLPDVLLAMDDLTFGVLVTYSPYPDENWVGRIAVV